ncbi:Uncharacterized protein Rs2_05126 [Raphanus sativus]|nr:Uncharacterized protein Rs2_05126 [Raphanus sativus]
MLVKKSFSAAEIPAEQGDGRDQQQLDRFDPESEDNEPEDLHEKMVESKDEEDSKEKSPSGDKSEYGSCSLHSLCIDVLVLPRNELKLFDAQAKLKSSASRRDCTLTDRYTWLEDTCTLTDRYTCALIELRHGYLSFRRLVRFNFSSSSDLTVASSDLAVALSDLAVALSDLAVASSDLAVASLDLVVASSDLAVASSDLAIASSDRHSFDGSRWTTLQRRSSSPENSSPPEFVTADLNMR